MRWRFPGPHDHKEEQERARIVTRMDSWWEEFGKRTSDLDAHFNGRLEWNLPEWMAHHLQAIHKGLMWEFGPGIGGGHRLVITPESRRHLRPMVDVLLRRAPSLAGWEFYTYRLPEDVDTAVSLVKARVGRDIAASKVKLQKNSSNRVDFVLCLPDCPGEEDPRSRECAFVAAETLLGEETLDKWVGVVGASPLPDVRNPLGLAQARRATDSLCGSIRDQLQATPCFQWAPQAQWTMWELRPKERDDYPLQTDLFVGKSACPDLWSSARNGIFFSGRFSRCGETFCYVKLDGKDGLDQERFKDKAEIEDALDKALMASELGCCIGGGTGLRYSYIDLALTDLALAIPAIQEVLRKGNVPIRSWLLFFDDEWADEWVGIWDHTPPPPMPEGR